jgi:hypothetical protein
MEEMVLQGLVLYCSEAGEEGHSFFIKKTVMRQLNDNRTIDFVCAMRSF